MRAQRRPLWGLALLLLVFQLPAFAALDERPPDDHDHYYTSPLVADLRAWSPRRAPGLVARRLAGLAPQEHPHPQLDNGLRLLWMGLFGPSRLHFRLAGWPAWCALLAGAWAAGRTLFDRRQLPHTGQLALLAVGASPVALVYSRKAEPWILLAAASAWTLVLAARALQRPASTRRWLALGLALGGRCYIHPLGLLDAALVGGCALVLARRERGAWLGAALAVALGSWWLGLWGAPAYAARAYWMWRRSYLTGRGSALQFTLAASLLDSLRLLATVHLMPPLLLALAWLRAPGTATAPAPQPTSGLWTPGARRALLWIPLLGQLPLLLRARTQGGYLADWLPLWLPLVLLIIGSRRQAGRWRPLAAVAVFNVLGPLLLGVLGGAVAPTGPAASALAALASPFRSGEKTWAPHTHHLPARVGPALAHALESLDETAPVLDGHHLVRSSPDDCSWSWRPSWRPHALDWPALFAGLPPLERRYGGGDRASGTAGPAVVISLWIDKRHADQAAPPDERCLAEARALVAERYGEPGPLYPDPLQTLPAMPTDAPAGYLHLVWIVESD